MQIKIFFNDKPLFLCDAIDPTIEPLTHRHDVMFIDELNGATVKTMINEMQRSNVHAGIFLHDNLEQLKKAFQKKFTLVQAAGGLVLDNQQDILMIFRRGKWDLPKGKVDSGEKIESCALREVEEETGLIQVQRKSFLMITQHTYHEGSKHVLKETHWFMMSVAGPQPLRPQTEEDITEIQWIRPADIHRYLKRSFPLVSDVMETAKEKGFIVF